MNPCEEYELLLSARLDGALSLKEETQLHAHLAQCPHCRSWPRSWRTFKPR